MAGMSVVGGHDMCMRPALKAGLRPLWRDRDTLQIGVDPRRARALTGLGKAAAIVALLDGSRETAEVARAAGDLRHRPEAVDRVLGLLAAAGVLDDFPAGLRAALPEYLVEDRSRAGLRRACLRARRRRRGGARPPPGGVRAGLRRGPGGRLRRDVPRRVRGRLGELPDAGSPGRRTSRPGGLGAADVGASLSAGVARAVHRVAPEVRTADDGRRLPDLAVLTGRPDPVVLADLMRDRVPHLAVHADEAIGVVGPLVLPGRSACVRCLDLSKAARDPAWPRILAQAGGARPARCRRRATPCSRRRPRRSRPGRRSCSSTGPASRPPPTGRSRWCCPAGSGSGAAGRPHPACTCGAACWSPRGFSRSAPSVVLASRARRRSAGPSSRLRGRPRDRRCRVRCAAQEAFRVGQVVRRRQQVRVRPQRVPPSIPRACVTPAHSAAASRSIRGRSSRPTRAAKVRSDGPPEARRRRIASASAAPCTSRESAAADTTVATQPSTRASAVSRRASAAFCCGVSSGRNSVSPLQRLAQRLLGVGHVDVRQGVAQLVHVHGDAGRVRLDRAEQVLAQPRHMAEQPVMRRLAQGEEQPHLAGVDGEARRRTR